MKHVPLLIITFILFISAIGPAVSEPMVDITSLFSDEQSMDVTLRSGSEPVQGQVVFKLMHKADVLETRTLDFEMDAKTETTKIIMWETRPQFETYVAIASVYVNGEPVAQNSYPFSYGFVVLPRFQVVDLSADSSGLDLLVKPRSVTNPGVADFKFQLVKDGDIIYSQTKNNIPIIQSTQVSLNWPILLDDHTDYMVRIKAYSHIPNITSSYVTRFTSRQEVEIDENDVEVDDFGVSVTLFGRSQVPFDGTVEVQLQNNGGNPLVFTGSPEILTLNRDDTVGILWDGIAPGTYHVYILVKTLDLEILDRYETVLLIPEPINPINQPTATQTPGYGVLMGILGIITMAAAMRKK
ncbi:MAG: hypothetical protein P1P72_01685 [ANME-2 cluster archaeon]|nr:hypothetical protein [ANME-2 cluster archaeon]